MAYQTGDEILDDHYNGFADDNTNNVNKILGTGNADFGYGQTNTVDTVSAGNTVQASQWNTLLTRMRSIADHQASGITTADSGQLSAGDIIAAIGTINADITTLANNRLNAASGNITVSNDVTGTRTFTGSWTTNTIHEWKATFASVDKARFFFNAGGYISWDGNLSGFTDREKTKDWENLLETRFGQFRLKAQTSSEDGNATPATNNVNTGYYDLGTSYGVIFKMFGGQLTYDYYDANFLQIEAKTNGTAGDNAANGNEVSIKVTLSDAAADDGASNTDQVDGNLKSAWGIGKPNTNFLNADVVGSITTAEVSQTQA